MFDTFSNEKTRFPYVFMAIFDGPHWFVNPPVLAVEMGMDDLYQAWLGLLRSEHEHS
jgi:hypothetical protein